MFTFPERSASGWCWTICRPTRSVLFTKPSLLAKRDACYAGWSSIYFVPEHASWLNMVEIEIGVLRSQCLDRRIDSQERLVSEIAAWELQRNSSRAPIKWMSQPRKPENGQSLP
jgi:hypothetical protein